ncbi:MAG: DUF5667 domain-containing protein [Candidatus Pacebacteria bacterium]|nr:DUF5667 domain-containing protein [Candidatus Paceibacterota bacterium]
MKKFNFIIVVLFLFSVSVVPVFTQAATKAGAKPGSFFYFFDRALEKTSLFFTFSSEKKAKKALEYAEERLAEAEELVKENKQEDAKKTIENYQENISLAEMEAKEIKDEAKTNDLLSIIASSTSKNQEVLERVLEKVPEEAKEGVQKAIEVSNKGDEGSTEEIEAPKKEVKAVEKTDNGLKEEGESKEKKEIINKKEEIIKKDDQANEIEKLKKEVEALKQKTSQVKIVEKIIEKPVIVESKQGSSSQTSSQIKQKEITLPNGSVVEMDEKGNVVRTIKEAQVNATTQASTGSVTLQSSASSQIETLEITSVAVVPSTASVKIEWMTNRSAESKLYLSGGGLNSKPFVSETGYSNKHLLNIAQLNPITEYTFQITAIGGGGFADIAGSFKTKIPGPTLQMTGGGNIPLGGGGYKISWNTTNASSCVASGDWKGERGKTGEYSLSSTNAGNYTYILTCAGDNGESVSKSINVNVFNTKPQITFYFNDVISNSFSGKVGEVVKLGWETSNTSGANSCTASNSWNGDKYIYGSQNIFLETEGEFSYTLTCINRASGESGINTATVIIIQ